MKKSTKKKVIRAWAVVGVQKGQLVMFTGQMPLFWTRTAARGYQTDHSHPTFITDKIVPCEISYTISKTK